MKIGEIIERIEAQVGGTPLPSVSRLASASPDPFRILVSTILSLRTKDQVAREASHRLMAKAPRPERLAKLSVRTIERIIFPVGFYRVKARRLRKIARVIDERYSGVVPDSIDELLRLEGVGRKTANLVVSLGYGKPGICVDTHVHRVCNRLGIVETKTPEQTEMALRQALPRHYWIGINGLLVRFGQQVCRPVSPLCSGCTLAPSCPKLGVEKSR